MIKRGDRVKLTARAAAAFNKNTRPGKFDWTARRGVVERASPPTKPTRSCCGTDASRRRSSQSAALNSNQSWDFPKPGTDYEPGRRTHLAWLVWFVFLCGLAIWMIFPL